MNPNNLENPSRNLIEKKEISDVTRQRLEYFVSKKNYFNLHRSDIELLLEGGFEELVPDLVKILIFNMIESLQKKPYIMIASDEVTHLATSFWGFDDVQKILSPYPEYKIIFTDMAEFCGFFYGRAGYKYTEIATQFYEYIGREDEIKKLENDNENKPKLDNESDEWKDALAEFINKIKPYLITEQERDTLFVEIKTKVRERLSEMG